MGCPCHRVRRLSGSASRWGMEFQQVIASPLSPGRFGLGCLGESVDWVGMSGRVGRSFEVEVEVDAA